MLASSPSPTNAFGPRQRSSHSIASKKTNPLFSPRSAPKKSNPLSPKGGNATFSSQAPRYQGSGSTADSQDPKKTTSDAGTQYTPPDWPPTSSRPSLRETKVVEEQSKHQPPIAESPRQSKGSTSTVAEKETSDDPPPELRLRVTPQSSLLQVFQSGRHERPSISDSSVESSNRSSPPSKQRALGRVIKVLPVDYTKCDTKHLSVLISDLLMDLIRHNDEIPLRDGQLTRFHSRFVHIPKLWRALI